MMVDSGSSDPVDPLAGFSVFSLLPRTFKFFSLDPTSRCENEGMNSLDAHLTALELKNPQRLLEQSKSVLDGHSEIPNLENESIAEKEAQICKDAAVGRNRENPQARRPALGRKRARFSLKPDPSQTVEILEPSIDIDQFKDPEMYFSAVERMENAKREIQRQRGVALMELDQNVPASKRPRRPGLSRKSKGYKHMYSAEVSGDDPYLFSSQEAFSQDNLDAADNCVGTETTDPWSSVEVENQAAHNVDLLLPDNNEDDEDDELIQMLQERYKPIELQKTSLPMLDEVRRSEYKTYEETLKRTIESTSHPSDISHVLNSEGSLFCNRKVEGSACSFVSPTPAKSPSAAISLLRKRLFQSIPDQYAFKDVDMDLSPSCNSPMIEKFDEQPNGVDVQKLNVPGKLKSLVQEKENNPFDSDIDNNIVHNGASDAMMDSASNGPSEMRKELVPEEAEHVVPDVKTDEVQADKHAEPNVEDPDIEKINHQAEDPESEMIDQNVESNLEDAEPEKIDQHGELNTEVLELEKTDQHSEPNGEDLEPEKIDQHGELNTEGLELQKTDQHSEPNGEDLEPEKIDQHGELNTEGLELEKTDQHSEPNSEDLEPEMIDQDAEDPDPKKTDQHAESDAQEPEPDQIYHHNELVTEDLEAEVNNQHAEPNTEEPVSEKDEQLSCPEQPTKTTRGAPKRKGLKGRKAREESLHLSDGREANTQSKAKVAPQKSISQKPVHDTTSLRRSTRIRMRPLEYWKGERQLFGRIEEGLITVIGAKVFSPDEKNGRPCLKVKSYVSDEYKDLLELAALH